MLRMKVKVRVAKSQGLHACMKVFDGGGAAAESELARPSVQIATIWRKLDNDDWRFDLFVSLIFHGFGF